MEDLTVQERELTMQVQVSLPLTADGGKGEAAASQTPACTVGQAAGVLLGEYEAELTPVGLMLLIWVE